MHAIHAGDIQDIEGPVAHIVTRHSEPLFTQPVGMLSGGGVTQVGGFLVDQTGVKWFCCGLPWTRAFVRARVHCCN